MKVIRANNTGPCHRVKRTILYPFKAVMNVAVDKTESVTSEMLKGAKKLGLSGGCPIPLEANEKAVAKRKSICQRQSQTEKRIQCQN